MNLNNIDVLISIKQVPLNKIKPGFCVDENGNTIFKTEYKDADENGDYRPICYNSSGERWHGDYDTLVRSIIIE